MDTSARRRRPPDQLEAFKRILIQAANLCVRQFPFKYPNLISGLFLLFFSPAQSWIRFHSYCYNIGSEKKTFDEATQACSALGAYLVDVADR